MKPVICFLICCFCFLGSSAQQEFSLTGYLGVAGGESFNYTLIFKDSAGIIKGYSLLWQKENKDVKTAFEGRIDRIQKTLSIRETEIIYNHGFESYTTICLITAHLKLIRENGTEKLSGPITSADVSHYHCGKGTIILTGDLKQLFSTTVQDTIPKPVKTLSTTIKQKQVKIVYDTVRIKEPISETPKQEVITTGKVKFYEWNADTILLSVWDGGKLDGDRIDLEADGELLLKNYTLTQQKKLISLPIGAGQIRTITITALYEGNEPPNTADILLTDGEKTYSVLAHNKLGKKAVISIKRKEAEN